MYAEGPGDTTTLLEGTVYGKRVARDRQGKWPEAKKGTLND